MDATLAQRLLTRWRLYGWSVGIGLVSAAFVVSTALDPTTLTPTTQEAVRATAETYYPTLSWPHAAGLVLLVYQGPSLFGIFGSILGFTFASVLLHGFQFGSAATATDFDHDASLATITAILAVVTVHGVVLTVAAYLPSLLFFASESGLVNPFGAWASFGPVLVVGFTLVGGLAIATAGVLSGQTSRGAVSLVGLLAPLAGVQFAHFAPTRHLRVGVVGLTVGLAVFSGLCWRALQRRAEEQS